MRHTLLCIRGSNPLLSDLKKLSFEFCILDIGVYWAKKCSYHLSLITCCWFWNFSVCGIGCTRTGVRLWNRESIRYILTQSNTMQPGGTPGAFNFVGWVDSALLQWIFQSFSLSWTVFSKLWIMSCSNGFWFILFINEKAGCVDSLFSIHIFINTWMFNFYICFQSLQQNSLQQSWRDLRFLVSLWLK